MSWVSEMLTVFYFLNLVERAQVFMLLFSLECTDIINTLLYIYFMSPLICHLYPPNLNNQLFCTTFATLVLIIQFLLIDVSSFALPVFWTTFRFILKTAALHKGLIILLTTWEGRQNNCSIRSVRTQPLLAEVFTLWCPDVRSYLSPSCTSQTLFP